jgi:hypothetical protein
MEVKTAYIPNQVEVHGQLAAPTASLPPTPVPWPPATYFTRGQALFRGLRGRKIAYKVTFKLLKTNLIHIAAPRPSNG